MIYKDEKHITIPSIADYHYLLFNKEFDAHSTGEAMEFIIARNLMEKLRPKCIKMIINSPGGDVASTFALIDTIRGSKIPVYTYGLGEIASCGLLTFISGKKGHRYITENTSILSHQYTSVAYGKEHELMSRIKEFNNITQRTMDHYKLCTGLSTKDIKKYLLPPEDVWLTAKQAIKFGIADHIIDFSP